jgi:hypothetical protein
MDVAANWKRDHVTSTPHIRYPLTDYGTDLRVFGGFAVRKMELVKK